MDRRDFVRYAATVAAAAAGLAAIGCNRGGSPTPSPSATTPSPAPPGSGKVGSNRHDPLLGGGKVAVASGADAAAMLTAAMTALGGTDQFVHKGDLVCIKPNLAWGQPPEVGANTSPQVLAEVIKMCQAAGAKEILVLDHTMDSHAVSFSMSGAEQVCRDLGARLVNLNSQSMYREVPLPQGVNLKSEAIGQDILDCDCYINLPCAKVHNATVVTLALKNQMGAVWDRQRYHQGQSESQKGGNLDQNIADLATGLRPTLTIVDGTRVLLTGGPKGPGKVVKANKLIVSADMVAADAAAAPLLGTKAHLVEHITVAGNMGLGVADPARIKIVRV